MLWIKYYVTVRGLGLVGGGVLLAGVSAVTGVTSIVPTLGFGAVGVGMSEL